MSHAFKQRATYPLLFEEADLLSADVRRGDR